MGRKAGAIPKRNILPDRKFGSILVQRFINKLILNGKKTIAERIVYTALDEMSQKLKKPALEILQTALDNVMPMVQLKSRRVGGANYKIPTEVSADRRMILGFQW